MLFRSFVKASDGCHTLRTSPHNTRRPHSVTTKATGRASIGRATLRPSATTQARSLTCAHLASKGVSETWLPMATPVRLQAARRRLMRSARKSSAAPIVPPPSREGPAKCTPTDRKLWSMVPPPPPYSPAHAVPRHHAARGLPAAHPPAGLRTPTNQSRRTPTATPALRTPHNSNPKHPAHRVQHPAPLGRRSS